MCIIFRASAAIQFVSQEITQKYVKDVTFMQIVEKV